MSSVTTDYCNGFVVRVKRLDIIDSGLEYFPIFGESGFSVIPFADMDVSKMENLRNHLSR